MEEEDISDPDSEDAPPAINVSQMYLYIYHSLIWASHKAVAAASTIMRDLGVIPIRERSALTAQKGRFVKTSPNAAPFAQGTNRVALLQKIGGPMPTGPSAVADSLKIACQLLDNVQEDINDIKQDLEVLKDRLVKSSLIIDHIVEKYLRVLL
jgi:hypothetical protein